MKVVYCWKLFIDESCLLKKVVYWWKLSMVESCLLRKVVYWWKFSIDESWTSLRSDSLWRFACGDVLFSPSKPETGETSPGRFPFFIFHFQTVTLGSIHNYRWKFKVSMSAQLSSRFLAGFSSLLFSSSAAEGQSNDYWAKRFETSPHSWHLTNLTYFIFKLSL